MAGVVRNIQLHALWRDVALATKPHVCECCGESDKTTVIEVHHVIAFKDCPAIGYCVENSAILCCRCHAHIHSGRPDLMTPVQEKLSLDTSRAGWLQSHINDTCQDYSDKVVVKSLRDGLRALIPPDYDTYGRVYYITNRLHHIETGKEWYKAHKKEKNEKTKAYYLAHKEEMKRLTHEWYVRNREKVLQRTKAYAAERREKYREYQRKYRATHREQINENHRRSRARLAEKKRDAVAITEVRNVE